MVLQLSCYDQNDYLSYLITHMYTYIHTFGGKDPTIIEGNGKNHTTC